jgi:hypothetical protein
MVLMVERAENEADEPKFSQKTCSPFCHFSTPENRNSNPEI